MAAPRASREFATEGDPWPTVDSWAGRAGYHVLEQEGERRVYRKGSGFWVGKRIVQVSASDGTAHVEAWVSSPFLTRLLSLFIIPREITVESGGPRAMLPRKLGRNELNDLLQSFGQSPAR